MGIDNNELKNIENLEREGYVPVYVNGDEKIVYFVKGKVDKPVKVVFERSVEDELEHLRIGVFDLKKEK